MQKGKGLHRRRERLRIFSAAAGIALIALCRGGASGAGRGEAPLRTIRGPLGGAAADSTIAAAFILSIENPYSIEGLLLSRLEAELSSRRCLAGFRWERLSHALYREDGVRGAVAVGIPGLRGAMAGVESWFLGRRAAGHAGERRFPVRLVAAWMGGSAAALVTVPARGGGASAGERSAWTCGVFAGRLAVALASYFPDGIANERRIDAAAFLGAGTTLRSSFAVRAGELSAGLRVEIRRWMLDFSWAVHPSLGVSASAGAGMRWKR